MHEHGEFQRTGLVIYIAEKESQQECRKSLPWVHVEYCEEQGGLRRRSAQTAIFLILGWFAAMTTVITNNGLDTVDLNLLLIPVLSRGVSGFHVLTCKPIGHSQYVKDYEDKSRSKYRAALIIQMLVIAAIAAVFSGDITRAAVVTVTVCASCAIAIFYARKNLGGMSGDIAGYGICISELAGVLALAIM